VTAEDKKEETKKDEKSLPSGAVTHEFQADVRKIMDIFIHSMFRNREIFLRELISNSADALDKTHYIYLTQPKSPANDAGEEPAMEIKVWADKEANTIYIRDGGVGMTAEELVKHLGSIGSSGTKRFLEQIGSSAQDMQLIGQFGVGFYSTFLVAERVRVRSKSDDSPVQSIWESGADGTYVVYPDPAGNTLGRGTEVALILKQDASEFLETSKLEEITIRYSQFITHPIFVQEKKTEKVQKKKEAAEGEEGEVTEEKEEEEVTKVSWKRVNEQPPVWTRKPGEVKEDEYVAFYHALTKEEEDPLEHSHFFAEGEVEFKSILYIPSKAPQQLFDSAQTALSNIKLYVRRVFITAEFKDLLPRYLNFIKGVVDSDDLPLNVSREFLQESRVLKIIKKKLIRKALSMLKDMADDDIKKLEEYKEEKEKAQKEGSDAEIEAPVAKYPKFWKEFGKPIRLGLIEDTANRARLTKLLRYPTTKSNGELRSLEEVVEGMLENQKHLYYIIGINQSPEDLSQNTALQSAKKLGIEVILMTDAIDEYTVAHVTEFASKKMVNLGKEDVELPGRDDKKSKRWLEKRKDANKDLTDWFKETLGPNVEKVMISDKLVDAPCIVSASKYGLTPGMISILKNTPLGEGAPNQDPRRVFEINLRHPVIDSIRKRIREDPTDQQAKDSALVLFETASFEAGFPIDDKVRFVSRLQRNAAAALGIATNDLVPEEDYGVSEEKEDEDAASSQAAEEPETETVEAEFPTPPKEAPKEASKEEAPRDEL